MHIALQKYNSFAIKACRTLEQTRDEVETVTDALFTEQRCSKYTRKRCVTTFLFGETTNAIVSKAGASKAFYFSCETKRVKNSILYSDWFLHDRTHKRRLVQHDIYKDTEKYISLDRERFIKAFFLAFTTSSSFPSPRSFFFLLAPGNRSGSVVPIGGVEFGLIGYNVSPLDL